MLSFLFKTKLSLVNLSLKKVQISLAVLSQTDILKNFNIFEHLESVATLIHKQFYKSF